MMQSNEISAEIVGPRQMKTKGCFDDDETKQCRE
jgi:hypothetical protein